MKKKILIAVIVFVVACAAALAAWYFTQNSKQNSEITTFEACAAKYPVTASFPGTCTVPGGRQFTEQAEATPENQREVLKQARAYKPQGSCAQVMTPAVHLATGAVHTFTTSCLPDGWEVSDD